MSDPTKVNSFDPHKALDDILEAASLGHEARIRIMVSGLRAYYETQDAVPPPNRFDPFKELDTILGFAGVDTALDRDGADTVRQSVHALRAYITGMER